MATPPPKYEFTPEFESDLIWAMCRTPDLFGRVGDSMEPEALSLPMHAALLTQCKLIARELGRGPSKPSVVVQRLRSLAEEGKATMADVRAAGVFLAEEREVAADEMLLMVVPILQKRAQKELVTRAITAYGTNAGVSGLIEDAERVRSMGVVDTSVGTIMGPNSFADIARLQCMDKLQTGLLELDVLTGGGPPRGTLSFVVADYGVGKSMFLCSQAAHAVYEGLFVGYLSLELDTPTVLARIKAALLGVSINSILEDPQGFLRAERMFARLLPKLGALVVHQMAPFSTMPEILAWKKKAEARVGRKMDLLCIDYMDKCASHNPRDRDSDYRAMNTVFETGRLDAKTNGYWLWTASQAKNVKMGEKTQARKVGGGDAADSINKARVADFVLGASPTEDRKAYLYTIDKFRTFDCAGMSCTLEHLRSHGRMTPHLVPDAEDVP